MFAGIISLAKVLVILAVSTWKWCTTLNWYMQLRKAAKIRELFELISQRSNASIGNIVRRVGHSLDDASLDVAIVRRGKCTSLLNLNELSEDSSNQAKCNRVCSDLRFSKSLTTLITSDSYDTNDTNDYDSISNELSVAEKSMKMLNITAEDIMDARARIQERSYWKERDATSKTANPVEQMTTYFPSLEKDGKERQDNFRNKQITVDNKKSNKEETVDVALRIKDATEYSPMEKEKEKNDSKTALQNRKREILTENREEAVNFWLLKNEHVTSDKIEDHVTSVKSRDVYTASREKKGGGQEATKIVQRSLSEYEKNAKAEPCSSHVKDMEAKFPAVPECYKWIGEVDQRKHSYRAETKPASAAANVIRKEHSRSSKMSLSTCHCALSTNINTQENKNDEYLQSTDIVDKNVNCDIDGKQFECFTSDVVIQNDRSNRHRSALKYLKYHVKKRAQTCEECSEEQPVDWNSMSLAQTARPSGYETRYVATDKSSVCQENWKSVQTETCDEPEDFLSRRHRFKYVQQAQQTQSSNLRLVNNLESFKKKSHIKFRRHDMIETRTLEAADLILLEDKKRIKRRNKYNLPSGRKLSLEEREAIELRALRAYNEQTLLEDKKELEARKKYNSPLNYERSVKQLEISKIQDSNGEEIETTTGNDLPTNRRQSIEKLEGSADYDKFPSSDRKLTAERRYDLSEHAAPLTREEDIKIPTRILDHLLQADNVFDRPSEAGVMSHLPETRDNNANSDFNLNGHSARRRRVSLNLWEITRNIEWTPHPRGITLTNKGLQGEHRENVGFRETQRNIVDSDTANLLHNAFFFKPEIIMRIFRRAQTRLEQSLSNFEAWRRSDFNAEFICRVNNETNIQDRDSLFGINLERILEDRSNLSNSLRLNDNSNDDAEEENGHDLCIIFIGRAESPGESEIAIVEDSIELPRNAPLNVENVQATNILVFDANCRRTNNATNDNLPVQFIITALRNLGIAVSEESIRDVSIEQIEEHRNMSNVTTINDFSSHTFNTNDINYDEENDNTDTVLLSLSSYSHDTVDDKNKQILYLNSNGLDNLDVVSSVKSLIHDHHDDSQDEEYLSAIDINFEDNVSKNNFSFVDHHVISQSLNFDNNNDDDDDDGIYQLRELNNEIEKNTFNLMLENSTEFSSPKMLSVKQTYSCQTSILKSSDHELQKVTRPSDKQTTSKDERKRSISNSGIKGDDTILQFQEVETSRLTTTTQNNVRNEGRDIYQRTNELTDQFPGMYSSDESDFNSLYEKNNDSSEPTLNGGSLMEEFSNDTIPLRTSSEIFVHNTLDNRN